MQQYFKSTCSQWFPQARPWQWIAWLLAMLQRPSMITRACTSVCWFPARGEYNIMARFTRQERNVLAVLLHRFMSDREGPLSQGVSSPLCHCNISFESKWQCFDSRQQGYPVQPTWLPHTATLEMFFRSASVRLLSEQPDYVSARPLVIKALCPDYRNTDDSSWTSWQLKQISHG